MPAAERDMYEGENVIEEDSSIAEAVISDDEGSEVCEVAISDGEFELCEATLGAGEDSKTD